MSTSVLYKSNHFLWLVFKLFIVIACGFFIYDFITNNEKLKFYDFQSILIDFNVFSTKNIGLLLVFSIFNWFLEITKWRILVKKVIPISFFTSAKQSLSSLTFSLITPNRIGEYGAKALCFQKEKRKDILIANLAGNLYQLLVTTLFGIIGSMYLINYFSFSLQHIFLLIIVSISVLLIIIFFLKKFKWFEKIQEAAKQQKSKSVLILSFLRYLVFSHQFYFLIMLFNLDISYWDAMACITSMYLISSFIPILSLFDFVVKGSIAVFIFSFFEINLAIILSITTLMWIYNFAIPAIVGSYFVITFKPVSL